MTRALAAGPAPAWFAGLIDDAALFPPENAAMSRALSAHSEHTTSRYAALIGPFLCPDRRIPELIRALDERPDRDAVLDLALVVTGGAGAIAPALAWAGRDRRLQLEAVEVSLRDEPDLGRNARRVAYALDAAEFPAGVGSRAGEPDADVPVFVEVPTVHGWETALDVLGEVGHHATLRTDGPDGPPAPADVARFLLACLDREVPFKCAAGPHPAVSHAGTPGQADGAPYGILNLLATTRAALDGVTEAELVELLTVTDPAPLIARLRAAAPQAASTRSWFRSLGCCRIAEPLAELEKLALPSH